ncbi:hypothetical protein Pint_33770 [Pistacia integerrima]|uniref:Uncharacterized protein n=1 Tax=Pistacia integerrima TaxID=434235 RepID=A0ACC0X8E1_9ROSI|nr:hypothetical protein Pint_33770 [Pistacia integerrima]
MMKRRAVHHQVNGFHIHIQRHIFLKAKNG